MTDTYAKMNAVTNPMANMARSSTESLSYILRKSYEQATNMSGAAMMKEKSAAALRAGAREARPEGEYLEDTDERCFFDGELIDVGDARLFRYFFCKEHEKTADDECHDDCHGRE